MRYLDGWNGYSDGSYQCSFLMVGMATVMGAINALAGRLNGYSDGSYQCSIWMVGMATVMGAINALSGWLEWLQ